MSCTTKELKFIKRRQKYVLIVYGYGNEIFNSKDKQEMWSLQGRVDSRWMPVLKDEKQLFLRLRSKG